MLAVRKEILRPATYLDRYSLQFEHLQVRLVAAYLLRDMLPGRVLLRI
jgi:hypothetical protein